jgi:phosphate transport system protein
MSWFCSAFQDELDGVTQSLLDLSSLVSSAVTQATHALLTADLSEAEAEIAAMLAFQQYVEDQKVLRLPN